MMSFQEKQQHVSGQGVDSALLLVLQHVEPKTMKHKSAEPLQKLHETA